MAECDKSQIRAKIAELIPLVGTLEAFDQRLHELLRSLG